MILLAVFGVLGGLAGSVPALTRRLGRDAGYPLAVGYLVAAALLGTRLTAVVDGHTIHVSWPWLPALGASLALQLDALSMVFALLALGVGALIMAYCPRYLERDGQHRQIYLMLTLFTTAMLGLVLADDLLLLFVFWELTSIFSFVLIGSAGPVAAQPAIRALLVTSGGGIALLIAVVILAVVFGHTGLGSILAEPDRPSTALMRAAEALILLAAFTKSAQVPFHFWLPNAMVAITPVSAYLHAATMVKAGIYLLLRFSLIFGDQLVWELTLLGSGLATAILGAVLALRQQDLKALLAYSTISQLGLLVAVVGIGTPAADAAAILYTGAHALFKATLFMLVGIIDHEAGSRDLRRLSGLGRVMPVTVLLTTLAAMSMAGLPPMLGFVGKEAILEAFRNAHGWPWLAPVVTGLGVLAAALTVAYATRLVHGIVAGPTQQPQLYEPSWAFLAPAAVAAAATVAAGTGVSSLSELVVQAAHEARPLGTAAHLAFWHGFTTTLLLSALTVLLGLVLFLFRRRILWRRVGAEEPGTPLLIRGFDRLYAGLLSFGALVGRPTRTDAPAAFLIAPILALVGLAGASVMLLPAVPGTVGDPSRPVDWLLLGLLGVTLGGLLTAGSALAAISLTGVVGLILSVWFLSAGAPDVALTLMLVEVLSTVVVMLVLRHQPVRLPHPGPRAARLSSGLIAVAFGLATAVAVATLTGRRPVSPPGVYYLTEGAKATGGSDLVNAILVDFRALDTLGEVTVLATVAAGLSALMRAHRPAVSEHLLSLPVSRGDPVLSSAYRLIAPVMVAISAYLYLRGHDEPGGGFIGALIAGIAVALGRLANPGVRPPLLGRLRARLLLAAGLLVSLTVGLAVLPAGAPFLTPVRIWTTGPAILPGSSSALFDLGVYLIVLALVVSAVRRLDNEPTVRNPVTSTRRGGDR